MLDWCVNEGIDCIKWGRMSQVEIMTNSWGSKHMIFGMKLSLKNQPYLEEFMA